MVYYYIEGLGLLGFTCGGSVSMEGLTYFERFRCIYGVFVDDNPHKGDIVNYLIDVFEVPRSTASKWQKDNDIPDTEVHYKIEKYFNLHTDIWTDNTWTDMVNFEQNIEDFRLIAKDDNEKSAVDKIVFSENKIPDDHPKSLYEKAIQLKKKEKIHDALKVIEALLDYKSRYVYNRYNEILLLKAVLLSHNKVRQFNEAIDILKLLYSAMKYHLENPEVLTLLGSNYKRKAFYDENGNLKEKDDININYLRLSLQNYEQALKIRSSERYYDAINIAYLKKILFGIDKNEVDKLCKVEPNWTPDETNWWEMATSAEFFMLSGDFENAKFTIDTFLEKETADPHDINATLRQIKLYRRAVQEDKIAQNFHAYIIECLESIQQPTKGVETKNTFNNSSKSLK